MVILHIAPMRDAPCNGMNVVIPQHVRAQADYAVVGFINVREMKVPNLPQQLDWNSSMHIKDLPNPFNHPDLVVFHGVYIPPYMRISKELRMTHTPYVIIPHGSLTIEAQKKSRIKKIVGNFVAFGRFVQGAVAIQYLSKREQEFSKFKIRGFIGTNGIQLPVKSSKQFSSESVDLLYIGRMEYYYKGLDLLIQAVSDNRQTMEKYRVLLNLYGPDKNNSHQIIQEMIGENRLDDIVKVHREVLGKDKQDRLMRADLFIQTSRTEGMPMGILEALSYGLPCIVTEGTTLGKIIEDADAGWCSATDPHSIAEAISRALQERDTWHQKSRNARKLIEERFSWDKIAGETVKKYAELIKK